MSETSQPSGQHTHYISRMMCCDRCYEDSLDGHLTSVRNKVVCDKCMEAMGAKLDKSINCWLIGPAFTESFNETFKKRG